MKTTLSPSVIPGWSEGPDPESRDSGFDASHRSGMTFGMNSMIDHISVGVADLERAARFYEAALAPLGLSRLVTRPATIGFGKSYPEFWINLRGAMAEVSPESGAHICLRARSTGDVDAFHAAALQAGGRSDGPPGLRP